MNILSFYNKILSCASLTTNVEGQVSATLGGAARPFSSKGKRVVLPTREILLNPKKDDIVIFHPLSENVLRGETEVMERYRSAINLTLNYRLSVLFGSLVELASSPAKHRKLTPEHLSLLTILKDADEKTFTALDSLLKAMPQGDTEKCFVNIFIKKNAVIGRSYRRGAIVTFPLNEALAGESPVVYGVKLRKKDHAAFKQLFDAIFPGIDVKGNYSRGGESDLAPTLDALLKAVVAIAGQINAVVDTYSDVIDEFGDLRFEDDWVEEAVNLDNFTNEARLLPSQVGNEGAVDTKQAAAPVALSAPGTIAMPTTQLYNQTPAWQQPASAVTASGLLDMRVLMQNNPSLAPVQPMQTGFGYPQQPINGAAALRAQGNTWSNAMMQYGNRGI